MATVFRAGGALFASTLCLAAGAAIADPTQVTADLNIRSGPGTMYGVVNTIPGGGTVDVADCTGGWCRVAWNGSSGWVSGNFLGGGTREMVTTTTTRTVMAPVRRTVVVDEPRTVVTTAPGYTTAGGYAVPGRANPYDNGYGYGRSFAYGDNDWGSPWSGGRYVGGNDPTYSWRNGRPMYATGYGYRSYGYVAPRSYAYVGPSTSGYVAPRSYAYIGSPADVDVVPMTTRRRVVVRGDRRVVRNWNWEPRRVVVRRDRRIVRNWDRAPRRVVVRRDRRMVRDTDRRMARRDLIEERRLQRRRNADERYARIRDDRRMARMRVREENRRMARTRRDDDRRMARRMREDMDGADDATGATGAVRRASTPMTRNGNGPSDEEMMLSRRRRGD